MLKKNKITIDYSICGDGNEVDPRDCVKCMQVCKPAIFLLHQTLGSREEDSCDPKKWRVTPLWTSLCNRCMECVAVCPVHAIEIK